jgi:hypothetical protein
METLGRTGGAVRRRPGVGAKRGRGKNRAGAGAKRGGGKNAALGGIAASLVIWLAACGSAVAGSPDPGGAPGSKAATPAAPRVNPGGPMVPAPDRHVLLCAEIPKLTRMVLTRAVFLPAHTREVQPAGVTVRNAAAVRRIATILCGLPKLPTGVMSCPNLIGGSYRLYFAAPGRRIPPVGIELSGCRVVTGLGPPRSWTTSKTLQQTLDQSLGVKFRWPPSPLR